MPPRHALLDQSVPTIHRLHRPAPAACSCCASSAIMMPDRMPSSLGPVVRRWRPVGASRRSFASGRPWGRTHLPARPSRIDASRTPGGAPWYVRTPLCKSYPLPDRRPDRPQPGRPQPEHLGHRSGFPAVRHRAEPPIYIPPVRRQRLLRWWVHRPRENQRPDHPRLVHPCCEAIQSLQRDVCLRTADGAPDRPVYDV